MSALSAAYLLAVVFIQYLSSKTDVDALFLPSLTLEQKDQYERDGYLVISDFFTDAEADVLMKRSAEIVEAYQPQDHVFTVFKSKDTDNKDADNKDADNKDAESVQQCVPSQDDKPKPDEESYFLHSADKISYFLEENALDANGGFLLPKNQSINKIAHALHVLDPVFASFSSHSRVKDMTAALDFKAPIILQSMVIYKQPRVGGKVSKHRDNTFLTTTPASAVGMWFALEDTTTENGCLWFVPGSHKDGASTKRFVRTGPLRATVNQHHLYGDIPADFVGEAPDNRGVELVMTGQDMHPYSDSEFVAVPVKKGSMILIHGEVVHMSLHNHSPKSRNIYTFHVVESYGTSFPATTWYLYLFLFCLCFFVLFLFLCMFYLMCVVYM